MAVDSFKNITMSFKGTGLSAIIDDVTVTRYATSLKGLTLEQANLALSTTQLSAREKELILTEAGLITSAQTLTAQEMVSSFQKEIGNKKDAERILIRAKLVTATELEEDATVKLTLAQIQEAVAKGRLSVEDAKLLTTTFGITGANYGEAVSFEVLTKAIWGTVVALGKFLFTNPVGWAILAAGAIAATVAIVDHFTVSLEKSKEQLKDLKDECKGIETDLKSMNDELKTTADRMKELEGKDTLTFTEKEEYDNLVKTNNELQRKIDLLELEQEINNREKNKTFVQTMVKDTENPFEYEVNPDGKSSVGQYSISDEYLTNETGYIKAQFEARKNLLDELSKAETQEEKDRIQASIDEIDSFLQSKNKEWSEIAQDISYIPNPTTEDEKAVNEWLDYINNFQDKMAIELGGTNAKTNAFNRLVDNWQFDGVVQGLQDLGKEGKVTAEMLNDPKYDEFIQKLVEIGVIDSADDLDLIALAFNNFKEKVEPTTNAVKTAISSTQELLAKYDDAFSNQSKIQSAFDKIQEGTSLTADEVRELVALCPDLAGKFKELADGYSISGEELINANKEMTNGVIKDITKQRDELVKILNTPMSVNSASDAKIAQDYFAEVETQIEALDLILTMFGINVQNTEETLEKQYEELSKSVTSFTSSQKDLNSALEEQNEHGQLSASTMQSLIDAGYAEALVIDKVTGAVTLNTEKYKELNNEKKKEIQLEIAKLKVDLINPYKEETTAIADLERSLSSLNEEERKATQIKIANMRANLANSNLTDEQRKQKEQQLAELEAMLASLDAPTFGDNSDPNKDEFDKLYSKWQHDLEMNKVTQEEYIEWLDGAYKQYFSDLTKYQDEYNKYEAEVYNARKDREQDLFDKKIENLKKLSDNALNKYVDSDGNELTVNASFDYAREQIYSAIEETQNRINELSLKTGFEDEIEELTSDLEDLYDTLEDINKQEIESQKEYIETLKDEYSDLMDEQIDQQKKLSEEIEKSYESRISAIDKQIDAIEKVNEIEERQNDILEARQALEKASVKNRLVYTGNGRWEAKRDEEAYQKAQKDYDEAIREEQIAKLEEQKELLETQRDNSKEYYDKAIEDLESQKEAREKQYDILVDIYEQLGGEKKQTSLNESLIEKLTANGDINKAVQNLTPSELKQAIESGVLTVDKDGNYSIDYEKILNKSSDDIEKIKNDTSKLTEILSGDIPETTENSNSSKTTKSTGENSKTTKLFDGYNNIKDILRDIFNGKISIQGFANIANTMMDNNIQRTIQKDISASSYFVNNNNNVSPTFNITNNFEGNPDDNAVNRFTNKLEQELSVYTQKLTSEFTKAITNQRYSRN